MKGITDSNLNGGQFSYFQFSSLIQQDIFHFLYPGRMVSKYERCMHDKLKEKLT